MTEKQQTVVAIDDGPGTRDSVGGLLRFVGLQPRVLDSVAEFLEDRHPNGPACPVPDVQLLGAERSSF
jgi:FixJ family two-component response regulator